MLVNGFLLQVGAGPARIENRLKTPKFEFNNLVFELAPSMAFDTVSVFPRGDNGPFKLTTNNLFGEYVSIWN